jgi:putative membrane protein
MKATRPSQLDTITTLAASLALGLLMAACDRRAVEDDATATPAETAATETTASDGAAVPPPVTDIDAPVATNTPEPPDPGDMSAGASPAASAPAPGAGTTSQADALALLIAVNEHEIAAADQALMKKASGPVLAYAQLMKTDHTKNLTDTTRLGGAASTAPAVTELRNKGEADLNALAAAQDGAAYEKAYIDAMVRGHTEALALIDGTLLPAATADNVRQHFTTTRAAVARHLERAKEIQGELK